MNKRIKKKKFKEYHKRFCNDLFENEDNDWECPKCHWDSLDADEEMKLIDKIEYDYGYLHSRFELFYTCPVCNTKFSYWDSKY